MTTARVSLFWGAIFFGSLFFLLFFFLNDLLPYTMTNDDEKTVIQLTAEALKVVAVMQAVDCIVNVSSGILKGAGKQAIGAATNFVGYYLVGLPVGVALMMDFGAGLKVPGYWWGQVIGLSIQSVVYVSYLTWKINWEKTAEEAVRIASATPAAVDAGNVEPKDAKDGDEDGTTPRVIVGRWNHLGKSVFVLVFLVAFIASLINSTIHYPIDLKYVPKNDTFCNGTWSMNGTICHGTVPTNGTYYDGTVPMNVTRFNGTVDPMGAANASGI